MNSRHATLKPHSVDKITAIKTLLVENISARNYKFTANLSPLFDTSSDLSFLSPIDNISVNEITDMTMLPTNYNGDAKYLSIIDNKYNNASILCITRVGVFVLSSSIPIK